MEYAALCFTLLVMFAAAPFSILVARSHMNTPNSQIDELTKRITEGDSQRAKDVARNLSPDEVGDVLVSMAGSRKSSARIVVLDLASTYHSEGSSRAILTLLQDGDLTVRSIAGSLIATIAQRDLTPAMFRLLDQSLDLPVKAALTRQIGMIGGESDLTRLRALYNSYKDPALKNDLTLAMARLGDKPSRDQLVVRLSAHDANTRTAALRDIQYVGDAKLGRHFRGVLEDRRDAVVISHPHDPVVTARVCDLAVQTLDAIGVKLPFKTSPTRRFTEDEIKVALQIVAALERIPVPSA